MSEIDIEVFEWLNEHPKYKSESILKNFFQESDIKSINMYRDQIKNIKDYYPLIYSLIIQSQLFNEEKKNMLIDFLKYFDLLEGNIIDVNYINFYKTKNQKLDLGDNINFIGQCNEDKLPHGLGTVYFDHVNKNGLWKNGKLEIPYIYVKKEFKLVITEKLDTLCNRGILELRNGVKFAGVFSNIHNTGYGTVSFNGNYYQGGWENLKPIGEGIIVRDGKKYDCFNGIKKQRKN